VADQRRFANRGKSDGTPSQRMLQVGEELRHMLAGLLRSYRPFPGKSREVSITVTQVRMSPDLRYAKVFVMPLGGGEEAEIILGALKKNAGFLTRQLAGKLPLKFLPIFHFLLDDSLDRAQKIDSLLGVL